ncbi:homeobox-leucine zipper protein hox32 [Phtheirospermum japonicum]|uniref:Homeobox-leucine zipper protein hox32 n=1 Tax=Phtheirospermum japonicum TaxID=374723 RepID=A0A830B3N6_9LAMI|nr:homeobox-leucine zipper protein hox32 [Phtheirospermum japonicum]
MALCFHRESNSSGSNNSGKQQQQMDAGKYVRYTPEQVEALERVYAECPKPTSLRRQQIIRECPILANIEPKQIKVWFQNRRCREKQRKESSRLQTVNRKLSAMNKLLMEENDRLQKQVSHLVYDNGHMRQQLQTVSTTTVDTGCESTAFMSGRQQQNPIPQLPKKDANGPAGGIAARACGLVSLEPTKVAEIYKDRMSWYRDCRCLDVASIIPTGNGGTIELIYMQTYALTTLAMARDFWTLRYTTTLEDGSLVICERSLTSSTGGPSGPPATCFVRGEMLPSGCLVRSCDGGGSIIHIVDHIDLDVMSVPEVLRPLYESSKILAQKMTIAALRHIRQIAQETNGEIQCSGGRQPAVLRALSQRLCRGFNDAVNGIVDDGWSIMDSDGADDNVPPALLIRFLREHRSEWADYGVDVYSAASLKASPYAVPCTKPGGFPSSQVILPLAQTVEHEESLEVVRLEGHAFSPEDLALSRDMYLLQLCSGTDEANSGGACAQLVFAPIDETFGDDASMLPSGFRVIPLVPKSDGTTAMTRTLDLASALEVGHGGARPAGDVDANNQNVRSVLTIAFQFTFESHYRDSVAIMARQYVRSIVGSVQRVAMAIAPSRLGSQMVPKPPDGSPEAVTLARWISRSYRLHTRKDLFQLDSHSGDAALKQLWHHSDAIMCCSVKMNASAVFTFANQAGLDMMETTLVALQDIMLEKILDEASRKILLNEFSNIMHRGYSSLPGGVCISSMGRAVSYEQAIVWKVLNDDDSNHCLAFMFVNWSFV